MNSIWLFKSRLLVSMVLFSLSSHIQADDVTVITVGSSLSTCMGWLSPGITSGANTKIHLSSIRL